MTIKLKNQTGSALSIAVFVIVVMALLAASISRTISSGSEQAVFEVFGTRALFAAESANEKVLAQIFPLDGAPGVCSANQTIRFSVNGLNNCVASTSCTVEDPESVGVNYYQVVSTGVCKTNLDNNTSDFSCGSEKICASRTIEVEAKGF